MVTFYAPGHKQPIKVVSKADSSKASKKAMYRIAKSVVARNTESKQYYTDLAGSFNLLSTTPSEVDTCHPVQGTGLQGRIGRQIKIKSIDIKAVFNGVDATQVFRLVLASCNGTTTTPFNTTFAATTINAVIRYNTMRNLLKRKFLDKFITMDVTHETAIKQFRYYKRFKKPIVMTWGDDADAYPNQRLILMCVSDSGSVSHPYVSQGWCVVTYEDA